MDIAIAAALLTVCPLAIVAIVVAFLYCKSKDRAALVETNAMLQYGIRKCLDTAVTPRDYQIDRIQVDADLREKLPARSDRARNDLDGPVPYYPEGFDRDYASEPAGGGV